MRYVCCTRCLVAQLIIFFFFNDTATTEIYTLSLHDALPISVRWMGLTETNAARTQAVVVSSDAAVEAEDRKSTRLNSSHVRISYAVFCLKKKNFQRFGKPRYARNTAHQRDG